MSKLHYLSKATGWEGSRALCECTPKMHHDSRETGKVRFDIFKGMENLIWRWVGKVKYSFLSESKRQQPQIQLFTGSSISLHTQGMYLHFSLCIICVLHGCGLSFTALWNTNSSHPRPFWETKSHQYCPAKYCMAPCSTFWSCSIGMMYYPRDLHMLRAQLPTIPFSLHPFIP